MRLLIYISILALSFSASAQQAQSTRDTKALFEHAKAATVVVLAGEGAGRLRSLSTGVLISKDGVILTALHAIKGAAEVQVRLSTEDVFDRVELLCSDERRDVAVDTLDRSLRLLKEWDKLGLTLVQDPRVADVCI